MSRLSWISNAFCFWAMCGACVSAGAETGEEMAPRIYPAADLMTPLSQVVEVRPDAVKQSPPAAGFHFEPLIAHIKKATGSQNWKEGRGEIFGRPQTLSLVIRQTQEMHEQIVAELRRLRKELDLQIATETIIVTGPRNVIAETATAFSGELGRFEQEQFRETLQKSKTLKTVFAPKITTFNRQTAVITSEGKSLVTHSVIADDRRTVRVKASYTPENQLAESIAICQSFDLHDGRAAVIRFEAPLTFGILPPADDAEECLVFVLPQAIVQEEEEVLLGVPTVSAKE